MKIFIRNILFLLAAALILQACSTTKHLQDDEVLYIGTRSLKIKDAAQPENRVKLRKKPYVSESVMQALWVKPNGALLGMPFIRSVPLRLYFYNWFYTERDSTFNSWMMENFGEPPVTLDKVNPDLRVDFVENYLFNRGYFDVSGDYQLKYKRRNSKKVWVKYTLYIPDPYKYNDVVVRDTALPAEMKESVDAFMQHSMIKSGKQFNLDEIAAEKQQLWEHLQNDGYYHLKKDHILMIADTTAGNHLVNMEYRFVPEDSALAFSKVTVDQVQIRVDRENFTSVNGKKTPLPNGKRLKNDLVEEIKKSNLANITPFRITNLPTGI